MDFSLSLAQTEIRDAIERLCKRFDDAYWRALDESGIFPKQFHAALAEGGWLGIAMPAEFGGAGLGITEAAIMMQTIAETGAAMSGASAVHMNIFGLQPVVVFGTEEQKRRMLPPLISGVDQACFAVTEADAGLNTAAIKVRAERRAKHYVVNGAKIWISTAQVANKVMLLARTSPATSEGDTHGLSLFYTDLDRAHIEVRPIRKMGRHAVDSNMLFFHDLQIAEDDRIGDEGNGFQYLLHGLNPERILIAAEACGIGYAAIRKAAAYARERVVFGRPIGKNQGIQHPLADAWVKLEAARLLTLRAATLYDSGLPSGVEANAAKLNASEAAFNACRVAVLTHGGMGYAAEYDVERYLRESFIPLIAPVSPHMILNHIAEKVLGLPKSY
jgi:acyl-CoA dehydrogenase